MCVIYYKRKFIIQTQAWDVSSAETGDWKKQHAVKYTFTPPATGALLGDTSSLSKGGKLLLATSHLSGIPCRSEINKPSKLFINKQIAPGRVWNPQKWLAWDGMQRGEGGGDLARGACVFFSTSSHMLFAHAMPLVSFWQEERQGKREKNKKLAQWL